MRRTIGNTMKSSTGTDQQQGYGSLGESNRAKAQRERKKHGPTARELEAEWSQVPDAADGIQRNKRTGMMRNVRVHIAP